MKEKKYCVKVFFDYDLVKEDIFFATNENEADKIFNDIITSYTDEIQKSEFRYTMDVEVVIRLYCISDNLMLPEYLAQYSFEKVFGFPPSGGDMVDICVSRAETCKKLMMDKLMMENNNEQV